MNLEIVQATRESIRKCIRRRDFEWSEQFFLSVLDAPRPKMEVYWAVLALRDCGTAASLPALKENLFFPMRDVRSCSVLTIAKIAGASESPLYGELLLDPKYPEKGYAMWAIVDVADDRAIAAVVKYLRKNMSGIRKGQLYNGALGDGVEYLGRYAEERPEVRRLLRDIWSHRELLAPAEVARFEATPPCTREKLDA